MTIDVRADAFLRGMVRRIVAVLLEVGHGNDWTTRRSGRRSPDRGPALDGAAAPAQGLCLRRVVLGRRPERTTTETNEDDERRRPIRPARARSSDAGSSSTRRTRRSAASPRAIARVLEGKHKPTYAAHLDTGDHVIVLNAARIAVTGDKLHDQDLRPPQRLSRRASRRRRSVTCSRAGRRRSSAAPSRACCRATAWAPSSSASSRSTPAPTIRTRPSSLSRCA